MREQVALLAVLMGLACSGSPAGGSEAERSSVVFYHAFEGKAEAQVAVSPKVEVVAGPATFAEGKRGQAMIAGDGKAHLIFDASNIPAREGTLEFWFKPVNWDGLQTDTFHVFVETDRDEKGNWFLVYKYYAAQNAGFIWENGGSIFQRQITGWRGWVHFAVTWSPEGCRMYFNGKPSAVTLPKNPPSKYVGKMMVGDRPWQFARDEHTLIDELYIYDRALEPEEITWAMENVETRTAGEDVPAGLVPTKVHAKILPSSGKIVAQVRHRLSEEKLTGVTGLAELLGPTPIAAASLTVKEKTAEAALPFTKLDTGDYTLRVQLRDASGKVIDEAIDTFSCPTNEWLGNTIGMSDTPPPPWTPVEASGETFACWGRRYELGKSGLPRAIASAGAPLLARAVQLRMTAKGQAAKWDYEAPELVEQSDVAAKYRGRWEGPLGTLRWEALGEYDGMLKYTLALAPAPGASVDHLELRFPLFQESATLHQCQLSSGTVVGATPGGEGTVVKAAGARYWWLGDEERGLLAFCESDEAWDRIDRPDGFRIERSGDTVEAVWSFIGGKTALEKPWSFTFGMTATPVKDTKGLRGRPSRVLPMNRWVMPRPRNYTAVGLEDVMANEGIREGDWGRFLVLWDGGEWATYDPTYGRPEVYREGMDKLAAKGLSVITYMMPQEIPHSVPEWRYWSAEWTMDNKTGWTNEVWERASSVPSWADFIVWFRTKAIERYGFAGYYIDNGPAYGGTNLEVGVGYVRDGRLRPATPYFGQREVFKRLYTAVKQYGAREKKPTLIMTHVSSEWPVAYLGFMDNRVDGEQYVAPVRMERKSYHDLIPLDKWRALNLSANVGSMAVFLPELHKDDIVTGTKTRELMGLLMLHDTIGVWFSVDGQANAEAVYAMWRVQDEFGAEDAELLPYWKNGNVIAGQTDAIKASAYRKPGGGALIVVVNLSNTPQTADLRVAWKQLTGAGTPSAADAESGDPLAVTGGALKLAIAPRDYRLIRCK
ncbi:MAG: glycoside hydrolase domain-containing protein [Planctomycetota bacterium]